MCVLLVINLLVLIVDENIEVVMFFKNKNNNTGSTFSKMSELIQSLFKETGTYKAR